MKEDKFKLDVPIKKVTEVKVIRADDKWILYEGKDNSYITFFKNDFEENEVYEFFKNSSKIEIEENLAKVFANNVIKEIDIRRNKI